jgi:rubredoxin
MGAVIGKNIVKKWKCLACCYVYGSTVSLPGTVVAPRTLFEQLSEGLCASLCGVSKSAFEEE